MSLVGSFGSTKNWHPFTTSPFLSTGQANQLTGLHWVHLLFTHPSSGEQQSEDLVQASPALPPAQTTQASLMHRTFSLGERPDLQQSASLVQAVPGGAQQIFCAAALVSGPQVNVAGSHLSHVAPQSSPAFFVVVFGLPQDVPLHFCAHLHSQPSLVGVFRSPLQSVKSFRHLHLAQFRRGNCLCVQQWCSAPGIDGEVSQAQFGPFAGASGTTSPSACSSGPPPNSRRFGWPTRHHPSGHRKRHEPRTNGILGRRHRPPPLAGRRRYHACQLPKGSTLLRRLSNAAGSGTPRHLASVPLRGFPTSDEEARRSPLRGVSDASAQQRKPVE